MPRIDAKPTFRTSLTAFLLLLILLSASACSGQNETANEPTMIYRTWTLKSIYPTQNVEGRSPAQQKKLHGTVIVLNTSTLKACGQSVPVKTIKVNRKSNNPMVLGFQGKAQVEALYGHVAEAMLSQPATKIFLKTSEPHVSEWISKAIGEIEVERFRESRTLGRFPVSPGRDSESRDITREPLVMASEVAGLDPLHGYFKHGNLVLRMRFPYLELEAKVEKFIERKPVERAVPVVAPAVPKAAPVAVQPPAPNNEQQHFFE